MLDAISLSLRGLLGSHLLSHSLLLSPALLLLFYYSVLASRIVCLSDGGGNYSACSQPTDSRQFTNPCLFHGLENLQGL